MSWLNSPLLNEKTESVEDEKRASLVSCFKKNKEKWCKLKLSKLTSTPENIKYKCGQTNLIVFFHELTDLID